MAHEFAEVSFSLKEILLMRYNINTGAYTGTVISMDSDQMLSIETEADTDDLYDSGVATRGLTVVKRATFTLGAGGYDVGALSVLTGASSSTSGTTPAQIATMTHTLGGSGLPYFGLIGAAPTDDGGIFTVGLKICKLNAVPGVEWDGKESKFSTSEVEGRVFGDSSSLKYFWTRRFETASDWDLLRPTTAAQFLTQLP
jgi:hypothetical protein